VNGAHDEVSGQLLLKQGDGEQAADAIADAVEALRGGTGTEQTEASMGGPAERGKGDGDAEGHGNSADHGFVLSSASRFNSG